jgi:ammonium transporter, Amt family
MTARQTGLALLCALPATAVAQETAFSGADTAWILTATALVLFMTLPGLALFYGGLVRTKNVLSVLMQCFVITGVVSILWLVAGYSLAFSGGNAFIGDLGNFMLGRIGEDTLSGSIPESLFAMYQMTFAIITPALVVGGFAERIKFPAMVLFSALWLMLVYVPVTHWVWSSEGWLFKMGLLDFAGGTVVHVTAGVAALVAAMVLGSRQGFPTTPMLPHNMTMTVTGAGMLWVGWFGFNAGSALGAGGNAAMAMLVTHISAAAGAMAWSVAEWKRYGKPSALGTVTGMVAGLGTITPASGFVGPGGALIIGLTAGVVCFVMTNFLKRVLKIDDSLDVFPVHGVGGILGTLAAGIFASDALGVFSGQGYNEGMTMGSQMGVQAIGVLATGAYTAVLTWIIFKLVGVLTGGLRVTGEEEQIGLDQVSHNERGYDL